MNAPASDRPQLLVTLLDWGMGHATRTLPLIEHAAAWIRRTVADKVSLRRMPRLSFRLDESLKKQAEVLSAINEGRRRDEEDRARRDTNGDQDEESTS